MPLDFIRLRMSDSCFIIYCNLIYNLRLIQNEIEGYSFFIAVIFAWVCSKKCLYSSESGCIGLCSNARLMLSISGIMRKVSSVNMAVENRSHTYVTANGVG